MGFRIVVVFSLVAPLLLGLAASSGQTAQAEPEPRYDSATTVDMMTVVADLREVPRGESAQWNSSARAAGIGQREFRDDRRLSWPR